MNSKRQLLKIKVFVTVIFIGVYSLWGFKGLSEAKVEKIKVFYFCML
jgi:hypothetical protein